MIFNNIKFREERLKQRWNLTTLAETSGYSRRSLTLWENGIRIPGEDKIRKLAKILIVQLSELSDISDDKKQSETNTKKLGEFCQNFVKVDQSQMNADYSKLITFATKQNDKLNQACAVINGLLNLEQVIFYVKDIHSKYIIANQEFNRNLSLLPTFDVKGKNDSDFYPINEAKVNMEQDKKVLLQGIPIINQEGFIAGSRKKKWGICSKYPLTDNSNNITGLFCLIIDTTEKREKQRMDDLVNIHINSMNDSLSISRSNFSKYLYLNKGHEKIYGYSNEIFYKKDHEFWLNTCIHPDDREQERQFMQNNSWPEKYKFRIIKPCSQIRWIQSNVTRNIRYMNHNCTIAIDTDITDFITNMRVG